MSVKDTRFQRQCPICLDTLPGTDDAVMVFECLKDQVAEIDLGKADFDKPNCTLCGEDCSLFKARQILARGEPKLLASASAAKALGMKSRLTLLTKDGKKYEY